ncbi:MAG: hypothetical protein QOI38_1303 [Sphingomonadales bacterium]|jgi:hypothetical protein|nr:hypothetical protein [Sphingomonadales bacterium]
MSDNEETVFQIALDAELADALKEALMKAAEEEGISKDAIEIEDADPSELESSLEFEPLSTAAALYVANLILGGVAGYFVSKALDRLIKEKEKPVIVIDPSGELLRLDPAKPEELQRLLERLRNAAA